MRAPKCEPDRSAAGSFDGAGSRVFWGEFMLVDIGSDVAPRNGKAAI
jgi:hypothetical protein